MTNRLLLSAPQKTTGLPVDEWTSRAGFRSTGAPSGATVFGGYHRLARGASFFISHATRISPAVYIFFITIASFFWFLGYEIYEGDQLIYFFDIIRGLDPTLFPTDILFGTGGFTFFDNIVLFSVQHLGLDMFVILFLLSVAMRFVYFYGVYRIFRFFTGNQFFSICVPVVLISGFVIYGTGMRTIASMLLPKYIALALCLLGLAFIFERKRLLAACVIGLGFIFHPTTPIPFLAIFYCSYLIDRRHFVSFRSLVELVIPPLFFAWVYYFVPAGEGSSLFAVFDDAWREVVMKRDSYYFVSTWYFPNTSPVYLAVSAYLFFLIRRELSEIMEDTRKRMVFLICIFIPLVLTVISLLFSDVLGSVIVTQLSFGRSLLLWKILLNGLFTYYAIRHISSYPRDAFYNFLLISLVLSFVVGEKLFFIFLPAQMFIWFIRTFGGRFPLWVQNLFSGAIVHLAVFLVTAPLAGYFWLRNNTEGFFEPLLLVISLAIAITACVALWRERTALTIPAFVGAFFIFFIFLYLRFIPLHITPPMLSYGPFREACTWVREHTSKDALFITEPFTSQSGPLRLLCYRSLFGTRKDGGQVVFNRDFALEWDKRYYGAVKSMQRDPSTIVGIARDYKVDYVFSDFPLLLPKKVFDNGIYYVYQFEQSIHD